MDLEGMAAVYPSLSPQAELNSNEIYGGVRRGYLALEDTIVTLKPDESEHKTNHGVNFATASTGNRIA